MQGFFFKMQIKDKTQTSASWSVLAPPAWLAFQSPAQSSQRQALCWTGEEQGECQPPSCFSFVTLETWWLGYGFGQVSGGQNRRTGVVFKSLWPLSRSLGGQNTSRSLTFKCTARESQVGARRWESGMGQQGTPST